ncbi:MAG: aminotransferase class V-fold PLP-dependent enzyme [Planctomycetes bacterium]|nr:aminotransferase class V-fold PLP-dependent enzyme [Planctomycetota bacterium]
MTGLARAPYDVAALRARFPALAAASDHVPLDNAATTHRPQGVFDALASFYMAANANVHRANHRLGTAATGAYEGARARLARFLGAAADELVFTRSATEAVNLVARGWAEPRLGPGDAVAVTLLEHHSNLVPWQEVCRRTGARLDVLPVDDQACLRPIELAPDVRLLAATRVSNAVGTLVDTTALVDHAHARGAAVLLDVTQAVAHLPLDDGSRRAEFLVLSAHKAYGPMGVGALRASRAVLGEIRPVVFGGEMVERVDALGATFRAPPHGLEAGTPPVADAVAFVAALDLLDELGLAAVRAHELELLARLLAGLARVPGVEVVGPPDAESRSGVVSLDIPGGDVHVAATLLDLHDVAVRAGFHCAEPLLRRLGRAGTLRASLASYSTVDDVDRFLEALAEAVPACRG